MFKKIFLLPVLFLAACISVSVEEPPTPAQIGFVTATLPPTKIARIPPTFTPAALITQTPTLAVTIPANCRNSAVLLRDVTIPDDTKLNAGETFTKTWEFMNNGTCPWINYTVKFAAGDRMNAPDSSPIPATLAGEKVQVSVELKAPATDGKYTGYFTLNDPNGKDVPIGAEKTFWVRIIVGSGTGAQMNVARSNVHGYTGTGGSWSE